MFKKIKTMFKKIKKYFANQSYQARVEDVAMAILATGVNPSSVAKMSVAVVDDIDKIIAAKFKERK